MPRPIGGPGGGNGKNDVALAISGFSPDTGISSSDGITTVDGGLVFAGTGDPTKIVYFYVDGVKIGEVGWASAPNPDGSYDWSFTLGHADLAPAGISAEGSYEITVGYETTAKNGTLTKPTFSAPFTLTSDTSIAPPMATGAALTKDPTPGFSSTAGAGGSVEVFANGQSVGFTIAGVTGAWQPPDAAAALADGAYQITAVATEGTPGNDTIIGDNNANRLDGGAGNDRLEGLGGADVYVFQRGYGQDVFADAPIWPNDPMGDAVEFGPDIAAADLRFSRPTPGSAHLVVEIVGTTDKFTVENQFAVVANTNYRIEEFRFADGSVLTDADIRRMLVQGTAAAETIIGFDDSQERFDGLAGNDRLEGLGRNDIYVFGSGSGQDTAFDHANTRWATDVDVVEFKPGIEPGDLSYAQISPYVQYGRSGNDLVIGLADSSDSLRIQNHYNQYYRIEGFRFADGFYWTHNDVPLYRVVATDNATGTESWIGGWNPDYMDGRGGADYLAGGAGNDTIEGGAGTDTMKGDAGSDNYLFYRGDGQDTIDNQGYGAENDSLFFGSGITAEQLWFTREANNLVIRVVGGDDRVTVLNWFTSTANRIDKIEIADKVLDDADVAQLVAAMAPYAPPAGSDPNLPANILTALRPTLDGVWESKPTLVGTSAGETIYGFNEQADVIDGGAGNDFLAGILGGDTYIFKRGSGQDTVSEYGGSAWNTDIDAVEFGAGLKPRDLAYATVNANLQYGRSGDNLVIGIAGVTDKVTIQGQYTVTSGAEYGRVERFLFGDGFTWSNLDVPVYRVVMGSGSTTWNGGPTNDYFNGQAGNDTINGGDGNDTIEGGTGNDALAGGAGNDHYLMYRGHGQDTIDNQGRGGDADHLFFGDYLTHEQLWLTRENTNDLVVRIVGTEDKVTVTNWFASDANQIDKIEVANRELDNSDVAPLVQAMAAFAPPSGSDPNLPPAVLAALQPALAAAWDPRPAIAFGSLSGDTGASANDWLTKDNTPIVSGSAGIGASVTLHIEPAGGTPYQLGTTTAANGTWSFALANPNGGVLADGNYVLRIVVKDAAGNQTAVTQALAIDTSTGQPTVTGAALTNDSTPGFSGAAEAGSTVEVFANGQSVGFAIAGVTGAWALLDTSVALVNGAYQITAVATDLAGNVSAASAAHAITVDAVRLRPTDGLYLDQWHLNLLDDQGSQEWAIEKIWADYTGAGVSVGVYDDGIEYRHHDLDDNYDATKHLVYNGQVLDPAPSTLDEAKHGTAVAGVIAAEANGVGTVGVAFGASLTGVNIFSGIANVNSSTPAGYLAVADQQYLFDVVNHSWGSAPVYTNNTSQITTATTAGFARAAAEGRDGLGTIVVKAAGNNADSANGDALNTTRHALVVGAQDWEGDASWYTNRGPNLLVSAPTSGNTFDGDLRIVTTDRLGGEGYAPDDYTWTDSTGFGGTSSAAPTVAGVVALMLDANPNLGWRDVQTILSYSAHGLGSYDGPLADPDETLPVDENGDGVIDYFVTLPVEYDAWGYNGADNWNGGGLHYSGDYGYGGVDAFNAVRMAEVWSLFETPQTSANEVVENDLARVDTAGDPSLSYNAHGFNGESDTVSATWTYSGGPMALEYVNFSLEIYLVYMEGVTFTLTSPEGTTVTLMEPLMNDYTPFFTFFGIPVPVYWSWSFGIQAFKGEDPTGDWTFTIHEDNSTYDTENYPGFGELEGGEVTWFEFDFFGKAIDQDDVYHYTEEVFQALADEPGRLTLGDGGGADWLNLAAMTGDLSIDLASDGTGGGLAAGAGSFVQISSGTVIENAVSGDGNDTLRGNQGVNKLYGMRGDDLIEGAAGDDRLAGGPGDDVFLISAGDGFDIIEDFQAGAGSEDRLWLDGISGYTASDEGGNARLDFAEGGGVLLLGVNYAALHADDFLLS